MIALGLHLSPLAAQRLSLPLVVLRDLFDPLAGAIRLAGVRAMISSSIGELRTAAVMSVSIQPGATALS
jgi:hypothetical protein